LEPIFDLEPEPLFDPSQPLAEASDDLAHEENAPATLQASPTPKLLDEGLGKLILIGSIVGGVILVIVLAFVLWPSPKKPKRSDRRAAAMQPAPRTPPMRRAPPVMAGRPDAGTRAAPMKTADAGVAADPMGAADAGAPGMASAAAPPDAPDPDESRLTVKEKRNRLMAKAYRLIRRGRYAESRTYLTRALKIDDSARLRRYFSRSYEKVGKPWPAIYHMKKAVKFSPRNARQHAKLGVLYLRVGQYGNACRSFRYSFRYKPGLKLAKRQLEKHCQGK
jgi:tetratricopeptide (TPR) repeat protein